MAFNRDILKSNRQQGRFIANAVHEEVFMQMSRPAVSFIVYVSLLRPSRRSWTACRHVQKWEL